MICDFIQPCARQHTLVFKLYNGLAQQKNNFWTKFGQLRVTLSLMLTTLIRLSTNMLHRHTLHSQYLLGYWARSSAFLKKFDMAESWTSLGDLGGRRLLKQRNLKVSQTLVLSFSEFPALLRDLRGRTIRGTCTPRGKPKKFSLYFIGS